MIRNIEEHEKKCFAAMKPVADDLRKIGLEIKKGDFTHMQAKNGVILSLKELGTEQKEDDLQYLSKKYNPLPKEAVEILLNWIPKISYPPVQMILIGQLSRTKVRYNGNILLNIFKEVDDSMVRERIDFVLCETKPEIDIQELESILLDPKYEKKDALVYTGIKFLPKDKMNNFFLSWFDNDILIALGGLKKIGGQKELDFLKDRLSTGVFDKETKKEIEKIIKKIEDRLKPASSTISAND